MTPKPKKPLGPAVLQRVARGDPAAFGLVYDQLAGPLTQLAYRMLEDFDRAQEIVQETFLRLWRLCREGGHERIHRDARSYVFRIAVNLCYDHLRRRRKFPGVSLDEPLRGEPGEGVISLHDVLADARHRSVRTLLDDQRVHRWFEDGLEHLSLHEKTALLLREKEGMSYAQIAEVMEVSLVQVKSWLHRGRRKMIKRIQTLFSENDDGKAMPENSGDSLRVL